MPLLHVLKQRLSTAQNDCVDHQPEFIDQTGVIMLDTRVAPPTTYMSLPGCCFSRRISSKSRTIRVVFHATLSSVLERTMWGVLSAYRPIANRRFRSSSRACRSRANCRWDWPAPQASILPRRDTTHGPGCRCPLSRAFQRHHSMSHHRLQLPNRVLHSVPQGCPARVACCPLRS